MKRLLTGLVLAAGFLLLFTRGKEHYAFYGDSLGYYMYLPATFLYHNLSHMDSLPDNRGIRPFVRNYARNMRQQYRSETGKVVNQYTYGVALMELPFFAAAHAWALATGALANGFSAPYQHALHAASLFYALLGLWLLYRVLKRFYPDKTAACTVLLLLAGSNLFWFTFHHPGMAHTPLFFLVSLLLYASVRLQERPAPAYFIIAGLSLGLITVIRPTDLVFLLLPLGYGIYNRSSLKQQYQFWRGQLPGLILSCACFLLPILPQLLYWQLQSGHWIYDSYGPGQGFDFAHPHWLAGWFGPRNGWLVYSPFMICAVAGCLLPRRFKVMALPVLLLLPLYSYLIYSWYCYDYINGFGSRPMIHIYPLLAFPLAALLQWLAAGPLLLRLVLYPLLLLLCLCGLSFVLQQSLGILRSEASNYAYNKQILFRYRLRYNDLVTYDVARPPADTSGAQLLSGPYPILLPDTGLNSSRDAAGQLVYAIPAEATYPPVQSVLTYAQNTMAAARFVRCFGSFYAPEPVEDMYANQLLVVQVTRGDTVLRWEGFRINNKIGKRQLQHPQLFEVVTGRWDQLYFDMPLPAGLRDGDQIKMLLWNIGNNRLSVKNAGMALYR